MHTTLLSFLQHLKNVNTKGDSISLNIRSDHFDFVISTRPWSHKTSRTLEISGFADMPDIRWVETYRLAEVDKGIITEKEAVVMVWEFIHNHNIKLIQKRTPHNLAGLDNIKLQALEFAKMYWDEKETFPEGIKLKIYFGKNTTLDTCFLMFSSHWSEAYQEIVFHLYNPLGDSERVVLKNTEITMDQLSDIGRRIRKARNTFLS